MEVLLRHSSKKLPQKKIFYESGTSIRPPSRSNVIPTSHVWGADHQAVVYGSKRQGHGKIYNVHVTN